METMHSDKAVIGKDPSGHYIPHSHRQQQFIHGTSRAMAASATNTTYSVFNSEQKTKIKMSKIAPKQGQESSGDLNRRHIIGAASSHEKLFKKKNTRGIGTSVGSNDEMFRKKTMKRLVDDADVLN